MNLNQIASGNQWRYPALWPIFNTWYFTIFGIQHFFYILRINILKWHKVQHEQPRSFNLLSSPTLSACSWAAHGRRVCRPVEACPPPCSGSVTRWDTASLWTGTGPCAAPQRRASTVRPATPVSGHGTGTRTLGSRDIFWVLNSWLVEVAMHAFMDRLFRDALDEDNNVRIAFIHNWNDQEC